MKISDHILSIAVIALVMTTAGAGTASAQFGGLGKKLKQSVKTKVDDAARNAKIDAKNKAND